jgi:hypothetical protein
LRLLVRINIAIENMSVESGVEKPSPLPDFSRALLDQLAGEYRIVQDKIDKLAVSGSRSEAGL